MGCRRCPHHVRHGQVSEKDKSKIVFQDLCGLRLKQVQDQETPVKKVRGRGRPPAAPEAKRKILTKPTSLECIHHPFATEFDYFVCEVYQETFESKGLRNGVLPTKDIQFSEKLTGGSVTDMELL